MYQSGSQKAHSRYLAQYIVLKVQVHMPYTVKRENTFGMLCFLILVLHLSSKVLVKTSELNLYLVLIEETLMGLI